MEQYNIQYRRAATTGVQTIILSANSANEARAKFNQSQNPRGDKEITAIFCKTGSTKQYKVQYLLRGNKTPQTIYISAGSEEEVKAKFNQSSNPRGDKEILVIY
jgi:hypothetical protein